MPSSTHAATPGTGLPSNPNTSPAPDHDLDGYDIVSMGFALPSLAEAWHVPPASLTTALVMGNERRLHHAAMLSAMRFLTGLGLRGGVPLAITLCSDYGPQRHQAKLVSIMTIGVQAGTVGGGMIISRMIPGYGWQSVFILLHHVQGHDPSQRGCRLRGDVTHVQKHDSELQLGRSLPSAQQSLGSFQRPDGQEWVGDAAVRG